jgi:hypothetical protein
VLTTLTPPGFEFFEYLFKHVNTKCKRLEIVNDYRGLPTKDFKVLSFDIIGMDMLWRICLETFDSEVGQSAIALLNRIYKSVRVFFVYSDYNPFALVSL